MESSDRRDGKSNGRVNQASGSINTRYTAFIAMVDGESSYSRTGALVKPSPGHDGTPETPQLEAKKKSFDSFALPIARSTELLEAKAASSVPHLIKVATYHPRRVRSYEWPVIGQLAPSPRRRGDFLELCCMG